MISKKLQSRLKFVKATPLKNRAQTSAFSRRDKNYVIMDEEASELDKYDTFFDYEEELSDLKSSGEQYLEMIDADPFIVLEEKEDEDTASFEPIDTNSFIILEEIDDKKNSSLSVDNDKNKKYTDVIGFEFVQCDFVKDDGNRCKRQAPKGNTICSTHKRYIKKHDIK